MGSCTSRHFLLSICFLQLLLVIERQVFDFLGYMWAPICVNFFHIIFVIFGIFGAYQLRAKYIITYSVWNVLWIGWNIFLICFYLNIGILDRNSDILNIGTGSVSWFEINGYGCKPTYPTNITSEDPFRPVRPERVEECFLEYPIVEIIHSGVQCICALLGLLGAICIGRIFIDEDDDQSSRGGSTSKKSKKYRQSLYSIEFSPQIDTIRGHDNDLLTYHQQSDLRGIVELSPKPMTPRRVKRRSVMTRGTNNRQSTTSRRSGGTSNRNSVRNSRRKVHHQNPVTKIIEQQNSKLYSSGGVGGGGGGAIGGIGAIGGYIPNGIQTAMEQHSTLTVSNLKSLNNDYVQTKLTNIPTYHNANIQPDPIYYNMNASSPLIQQSWNASNSSGTGLLNHTHAIGGHINPSYQHSTPNLSHSPEPPDEPYHRPPSVRSSYSNFHGARPLSSHPIIAPTENVFVQLQHLGQNNNNNHSNHHNHNNAPSTSGSSQAIPQVPSRRVMNPPPPNPNDQPPPNLRTNRIDSSERSLAFINSGPPAYNLNYHTPPDSETTM